MARSYWWVPGGVAVGGLGAALFLGLGLGIGRQPQSTDYSLSGQAPEIVHAYEFTADHAEHAARIPCYCGCAELGHRHLLDCFVKPDGGWEPHATYCGVCRDEASDLEAMLAAGESIENIRVQIDQRYGRLGKPTDTP